MSSDFRTEPAGAGLVGTVTYRCHACGELIEGTVAYVTPTFTLIGTAVGIELTDARTYHPACIPKEN